VLKTQICVTRPQCVNKYITSYVTKKREELGLQYKHMYWLMCRRSALSTRKKLVLYKQILKPVWTFGIHLWGLHKTEQHSHNTGISKQSTQEHS